MIDASIVARIAARLSAALAPPAGPLLPLQVGAAIVGWLDPVRAARLVPFSDTFAGHADAVMLSPALSDAAARTAALDRVARALAAEGRLSAWRGEQYAVAGVFGELPLFLLERAAARWFGIVTYAAHVNGLVRDDDGIRMWFARRSPAKAIDPGMLDNLVGGGIAARQSVAATVVKEAREEAGIPAAMAASAQAAGALQICRAPSDGLQREAIFVHDLWLPAGFVPVGEDGEAVEHRLVTLPEAARLIALADGPDVVTADASLVVLDCLLRHGAIAPDTPGYLDLQALRHPSLDVVSASSRA
ncbi:MAG: DUF4743 domain-containing protein [Betaproteobacteria bacterium]